MVDKDRVEARRRVPVLLNRLTPVGTMLAITAIGILIVSSRIDEASGGPKKQPTPGRHSNAGSPARPRELPMQVAWVKEIISGWFTGTEPIDDEELKPLFASTGLPIAKAREWFTQARRRNALKPASETESLVWAYQECSGRRATYLGPNARNIWRIANDVAGQSSMRPVIVVFGSRRRPTDAWGKLWVLALVDDRDKEATKIIAMFGVPR